MNVDDTGAGSSARPPRSASGRFSSTAEPTLHPGFAELVEHALAEGLRAEVYSNLYRVRPDHWTLFTRPGISLATSYYADTDEGHDQVTGRRGSHAATRKNIIEAHRRGIPVRVGIVDVLDGQRVEEARADLAALGITNVHTDRMRGRRRGHPEHRRLKGHPRWTGNQRREGSPPRP